jgi:hypothetical protein
VRTNRADEFTAQFVGVGTGPLHVAKPPGIAGIETFEGHAFHTSRWDYAYTGGDCDGEPAYFRYIDQWRTSGDFAGLQFRRK